MDGASLPTDSERAFLAALYALGHRGSALLTALAAPSAAAHRLADALADPDRAARAAALAPILRQLVLELGPRPTRRQSAEVR